MAGNLSAEPIEGSFEKHVVPPFKNSQTHLAGSFPEQDGMSPISGIAFFGGQVRGDFLIFLDEGNIRFRNPVFRRGKQIIGSNGLSHRNAARMAVMNAGIDIDRKHVLGIGKPGDRRTFAGFFESFFGSFRIGVGSGTIRNAAISNIVIRRSGIGLLLQSAYSPGSGVDIYDLTVSGIRFDHTAHPVRICAGFPDTTAQIHHIAFTNLHGNCYANISVIGQKAARPHDISFEQCSFHVVKSPFRLAEQKDYPSVFLAVESADRLSTREFSWRQDEDSLPFWNPPPEAAGKPER